MSATEKLVDELADVWTLASVKEPYRPVLRAVKRSIRTRWEKLATLLDEVARQAVLKRMGGE